MNRFKSSCKLFWDLNGLRDKKQFKICLVRDFGPYQCRPESTELLLRGAVCRWQPKVTESARNDLNWGPGRCVLGRSLWKLCLCLGESDRTGLQLKESVC